MQKRMSVVKIALGGLLALAGVSVASPSSDTGTVMTVVPAQRMAPAGGVVEVQVFLRNAFGVGAYELHMAIQHEGVGGVELEKIIINKKRKNFLFGTSKVVEAIDMKGRRTAIITYGGGADTPADTDAYLATFRYRVSPDAEGRFFFNVDAVKSFVNNTRVQKIAFRKGPDAVVEIGKVTRTSPDRNAVGPR